MYFIAIVYGLLVYLGDGESLEPGRPVSLRLMMTSKFLRSSWVTVTRLAMTWRTQALICHVFRLVSPLRWKYSVILEWIRSGVRCSGLMRATMSTRSVAVNLAF